VDITLHTRGSTERDAVCCSRIKRIGKILRGPSRLALRPHALVALEFDTSPAGTGGGRNGAGTYLELGIAPGISESGFAIAIPVRVGLSLRNYYELAGIDQVRLPETWRASLRRRWRAVLRVAERLELEAAPDVPGAVHAGSLRLGRPVEADRDDRDRVLVPSYLARPA
jgi:hypothetical protein